MLEDGGIQARNDFNQGFTDCSVFEEGQPNARQKLYSIVKIDDIKSSAISNVKSGQC